MDPLGRAADRQHMALGPAWTRGEIEKPAGTKDMGSWTAAVYTDEQQARLGVDAEGKPKPKAKKETSDAGGNKTVKGVPFYLAWLLGLVGMWFSFASPLKGRIMTSVFSPDGLASHEPLILR